MSSLPTTLRRQLEGAVGRARTVAEDGARHALEALAVHEPDPYRHMDEAQRDLRRKLRAQAKQLGDGESQTKRGAYEIKHLAEKLAYDQWHRLLFARYLLENNLLISPEHEVSVTLEDCEELASSLGLKDAWAVAARFAAKELPEIFRADDPAGAVELSVNDRQPLIALVTGLPVEVFTASDSLGWCYQFWQAEKKDEVNAAGNKIGADELPAVTQLFTEDYMVDFLLDNTLGAWHAGKVLAANPKLAESTQSEDELREAVGLPGCPWKYLRFIKSKDGKWAPAGGTFDGWPKTAKTLKCLDPCMGSGHFVVAMFERMVALRLAEEKLDEAGIVAAVIADNLFGLELDPRCTQIGAFNLALAAWRRVGHCKLPAMNLACSGLGPNSREADWLTLADGHPKIQNGISRLYRLFKDAPELGSLINPRAAEGDLLEAAFHELQPFLEKALTLDTQDDATREMAVTAQGLAKAAEILASQFSLVATNVPFKETKQLAASIQNYISIHFSDGRANLATAFVLRITQLLSPCGIAALVTPHEWLFLKSYAATREALLNRTSWRLLADLGERAFQSSQAAGAFTALISFTNIQPSESNAYAGWDETKIKLPGDKALGLLNDELLFISQSDQLRNPDARIGLSTASGLPLLSKYAGAFVGLQNGDTPRFVAFFWEIPKMNATWSPFQLPCDATKPHGGREGILRWEGGNGTLSTSELARIQGREAWNKQGIAIRQTRKLPATSYSGDLYDQSSAVIVPNDPANLTAIWTYCFSTQFHDDVRRIDKKKNVTNATLVKVPFDLPHWTKKAAEEYPHGLPKPHSNDPTQWLFEGHPKGSNQPLHVGLARLLGYSWPRQTGSEFLGAPKLGSDSMGKATSDDGILCLSATMGETSAAERLRASLTKALGNFEVGALIARAGPNGSKSNSLEEWLRNEFFEQHCVLFYHRPFIWHIWDGQKSGFSALVNYHQLTHSNLEKLTYAYLGDWVRRQQAAVDVGESGSDARLQAAKELQLRLKKILEGEPPYDIFVRWKPLSKQPLGWQPDLSDGVRMNVRPFLAQDIPGGKKGAGILRAKPNISWEKDRGKEPVCDSLEFPWLWKGKNFTGDRVNDVNLTIQQKKQGRK